MALPFTSILAGASGQSKAATQTFIASTVEPLNLTTYTFASQTLKASMVLAVCMSGSATQAITSVTVGGITATAVIAQGNPDAETIIAIYRVSGVTPGTGSIVAVSTTGSNRCGIATWETVGRAATSSATSGVGFAAGGANPTSTTINVPAKGFVVAAVNQVNETGCTFTWAAGSTEVWDQTIETSATWSGSGANYTAAQAGLTIAATRSLTASSKGAMVVAAWAPA